MRMRFVQPKWGDKYLHQDDVIELLEDFAATESTDIKDRILQLIANLKKAAS